MYSEKLVRVEIFMDAQFMNAYLATIDLYLHIVDYVTTILFLCCERNKILIFYMNL